MIQIISGVKGSGKTKRLLDQTNDALKVEHGDIVFIDDDKRYMYDLRHALALDVQQSAAYTRQAEAIAALPVGASATDSAVDEAPAAPLSAAAEHASTMSEAEMEKAILNAAILNGALELLPESLSTMAIIPLQMKRVDRSGKSYGFELERGHRLPSPKAPLRGFAKPKTQRELKNIVRAYARKERAKWTTSSALSSAMA